MILTIKHTPRPWFVGSGLNVMDLPPRRCVFSTSPNGGGAKTIIAVAPTEADAALIASAPDLLRDLLDSEHWMQERAVVLLDLAGRGFGPAKVRQMLRDEAARHEGRAVVLRQTLLAHALIDVKGGAA